MYASIWDWVVKICFADRGLMPCVMEMNGDAVPSDACLESVLPQCPEEREVMLAQLAMSRHDCCHGIQ
jgi:hypothetical protein